MSERPEKSETIVKRYDFAGIEDNLLIKYKPEYLAQGGEHLVFEIPDHPHIVIKVSMESITESLNWQQSSGETAQAYAGNPDVQRELRHRIEMAEQAYRGVLEHFQSEHVLPQRYITFTVSITPEIIAQLARDYYKEEVVSMGGDFPSAVHVVALVQQKSVEMQSDQVESLFDYGYVVTDKSVEEEMEHFIFPATPARETSQDDDAKQKAKKDFVSRAIAYTKATGRILDIAGPNNVIFKETDAKMTYLLVDAVHPAHWDKTYTAFVLFMQEVAANEYHCDFGKMKNNASKVVHVVDYIYKLNQVAFEAGVTENLDALSWIPAADRPKAVELIKECIGVWNGEIQADTW